MLKIEAQRLKKGNISSPYLQTEKEKASHKNTSGCEKTATPKQQETSIQSRRGKKLLVSHRNGIVVKSSARSMALDPKRASSCDYAFVSHAHIDHVHAPDGKSNVLSSKETACLAKARGYDLGKFTESASGIDLIDSGHILGSRAVLIEDSVFYTGDFSRRDRGFLKGSPGVKCDTLIMETTYGMPKYVFTQTDSIVSKVSSLIAECFDKCRPVVLTGYALGKAQLITFLFKHWEPIFLHESVHRMNSLHRDFGIALPECVSFEISKPEDSKLLERRPWIMVSPSATGRSHFIRSMREKYGAIVMAFTGWAIDPSYRYSMGVDYAFDLSDHCDFKELVDLAKYCNPSKVYTVHGFAREFADHLNYLGFDAEPLDGNGQSRLTNF